MAVTTYLATLKKGASKLVDIIDFGDLGSPPEELDWTTTSDAFEKFLEGILEQGIIPFTANADSSLINSLRDPVGSAYSLDFNGKGTFTWTGTVDTYLMRGGVSEIVRMKVVCTPSSQITVS